MDLKKINLANSPVSTEPKSFIDGENRALAFSTSSLIKSFDSEVRNSGSWIGIESAVSENAVFLMDSYRGNVTTPSTTENLFTNLGEGVKLKQWKLHQNISAKLLGHSELGVTLECLVDKENRIYEERDFSRDLFDGFNLETSCFFKVCLYTRSNQQMIEIKEGSALVVKGDFPEVDFFQKFGNIDLVKKRD